MNATKQKPKTEVDFQKKWSNGHKSFTAAEARALGEILNTEHDAQENYLIKKSKMIKSRNPMAGDTTPRNSNGEPVLNPRAYDKVVRGVPLFPTDLAPMRELKKRPEAITKIGVVDERYEVLGNKGLHKTPAQPEDLYKLAQATANFRTLRQTEAEKLREFKEREHAKRQLQQLELEVTLLKSASAEKEAQIRTLRGKFG